MAYAIKRQYLYGEKLVAIVESKSTAETLCQKWQCKMYPVSSKLWAQIEEQT